MKIYKFLIPLIGLVPLSEASSVKLLTETNPKKIMVGDLITYRVTVTYSTSVAPIPFQPPQTLGEFEIRQYQPSPVETTPTKEYQQTHQFLLTTFSTGPQTIPSLTLLFSNESGEPASVQTQKVDIEVRSLLTELGDEGNLRPLKGTFTFRSYLWLWISLGVLAVFLFIFILVRTIRAKKRALGPPPAPLRPAEMIAWESIQALERSNLIQDGKIKDYYSQLCTLLRQYLENRYHFSALDRTTAELITEFRRLGLLGELNVLLRDILEVGDLVKFARFSPPEEEIEIDLDKTKQIIMMTTPQKKVDKIDNKKEKILV